MAKYRILSLDGGGSWALIQARALIELFRPLGDVSGHDVLSKFSYVTANSGGAIVLATMLEGMKLSEILKLFLTESQRQKIFAKLDFPAAVSHMPGSWATHGPRYYTDLKLTGLQGLLPNAGALTLAQAKARVESTVGHCPQLLITSFDYDRLRSIYFRSDDASVTANSQTTEPTTLAGAVHASSNAPLKYFDMPAEVITSTGPRRCWDGGVAACNNPVLAGLNEVIANQYNEPPTASQSAKIEVLSIGTGTVRLPMPDGTIPLGLATEWVRAWLPNNMERMATAILDDPPDAATFTVFTMLKGFQLPRSDCPLVRMNPMIQPILDESGKWSRPAGLKECAAEDPFVALVKLDMDAVKQPEVNLITRLANAWIDGHALNQPIRAFNNLQCDLGQNKFADALGAWQAKLRADGDVC